MLPASVETISDIPSANLLPAGARFSDRCLQALDEGVPNGLWICDSGGGVGYLSPAFLDLVGMDLEKCRSDGWACRLDPDEAQATIEKWKRCMSEGSVWDHRYRLRDASGNLRHILSRGTPVKNPDGRPVAWVGINLDITEIKETEEELRQSQERFRVALESGCDLLYECDAATGARRWFGPVDDMLGYAQGAFPRTESAWEEALHPEDRDSVLRARNLHGEGRSPFHIEYRIRRPDGQILHWLDRGKAMRDPEGIPQLWVGFVTDITERIRAAELLRKSEERRRIAQKLEVIGKLAGGIAHDFNNLLTAINGYSELVLAQLDDEDELKPQVKEILRAGERAALLTRQLLAFSRKQVVAPKVLDLNGLIRDLAKAMGEFLGSTIDVRFQLDPNLGRIKADPAQVEQVLLNLVWNARDAMALGGSFIIQTGNMQVDKEGFAALQGEATRKSDGEEEDELRPGRYVVLTVQDSGTGMDEETISHLFEPFYTTKDRSQGLGLSAVYGIMKQCGGYITVSSRKGEGCLMRIFWPRLEETQMLPSDFPFSGFGLDRFGHRAA